jgi:tetratricopeptide (TPR) repeat protein
VKGQAAWVLAVLALTACTLPARKPAAPPPPGSVAELASIIDADARKSDHETDPHVRADLAAETRRDADACLAQAPQAVACVFGSALALGLEAREHPARALATLNDMLATLARAEAIDAAYAEAGPARVQALVLTRAPGWPLGPGDAERAVEAAHRAVALRPSYPPNWLALAEAQSKEGSAADAQASYARARDAARALPENSDRARWLREAEQHLSPSS